jgi:transposase-like protein
MEATETQQSESPNAGQTTGTSAEADTATKSPSVKQVGAEEAPRVFPPLRKLSDEQERELTRLYAEGTMPAREIARRFGIAESSIYRIAQRHGARPRGGPPARAQLGPEVSTASAAPAVPLDWPRPRAPARRRARTVAERRRAMM